MEGAIRGTQWKLATADGRKWPVGHERDVTLEFGARRLGGWNGCNSYGADWRMPEGRRLEVGPVQATSMGCSDEGAWVQQLLWEVLRASPMVTFPDKELRLKAPAGVLVFSKA